MDGRFFYEFDEKRNSKIVNSDELTPRIILGEIKSTFVSPPIRAVAKSEEKICCPRKCAKKDEKKNSFLDFVLFSRLFASFAGNV